MGEIKREFTVVPYARSSAGKTLAERNPSSGEMFVT